MSTLLQEIEAQIAGIKTATARQNVGTVREISDGVAKIEGLSGAASLAGVAGFVSATMPTSSE